MSVWAVVPTKPLDAAKGRLADGFGPEARRALAAAMLADVLSALVASERLARVLVVSVDPEALVLAEAHGASPLPEPTGSGELDRGPEAPEARLNAALDYAAREAAAGGGKALLVVPADVPLVTPDDVATLLDPRLPRAAVVVAPTWDGGTGALLRRPPEVVPARFGPGSLGAHLGAAAIAGVLARLVWRANLALDVDRPEDAARLRALPPRTRTQALLARMARAAP